MENYSAELDDAEVDESGDAGGDHDGELGEEGVVRRAPVLIAIHFVGLEIRRAYVTPIQLMRSRHRPFQ